MKKKLNKSKHQPYKNALGMMKEAKKDGSLPNLFASITLAESLIADRTQSFVNYKYKGWLEKKEKKRGLYLNRSSN